MSKADVNSMSTPERRFGLKVLAAPGGITLLVGLLLPLVLVIKDSIWLPDLSIEAYVAVLGDPVVIGALMRTFVIAAMVTLLSIAGGYLVALTAWNSRPAMAGIVLLVASSPILTSVVMRNFAWTIILGRNGPLNGILLAIGAIDQPLAYLNSVPAVVVGMFHVMLPFAVLPIYNALRRIDPVLLRASAAAGASSFTTFRRVTLPLSAPGGVVAGVFVFVLSLGFFVTPALLGGPANSMIANVIDKEANSYLAFDKAAAAAVILLAVVVLLLAVVAKRFDVSRVFRG